MIKTYSLLALQTAINYALSLDPTTVDKLQLLDQRVLEIVIIPLQVNFFIYIDNSILKLVDVPPKAADTIIHSSPLGLIRLSLLPTSKVRSLFNDKMRITGDLELGMAVKALFDTLDIDWEGHLAHFTGDVIAYQLGSWWRRGRAFKQRLTNSVSDSITAYITEEARWVPSQEELADFMRDVDEISLRAERLAAHINRLSSTNDSV